MQTMQPILTDTLEQSDEFLYEIKYDGFRALLHWNKTGIAIKSRNNTDLTSKFPEIIDACKAYQTFVDEFLPIQLDGELVVLNNHYEANFSLIQQRGRMRSERKINEAVAKRPVIFLVFDMLIWKGSEIRHERLFERKQMLNALFQIIHHERLQIVPVFSTYDAIKKIANEYMVEGIVAKRKDATYTPGKKHHDWLKEKNWRTIHGFLIAYQPDNGYFQLGVFVDEDIKTIGHCKHGLTNQEREALQQIFIKEGNRNGKEFTIPPAICAAIHTLGITEGELREPSFVQLMPNMDAKTCTLEKIHTDLTMIPDSVIISNEDKLYWPEAVLTKIELILYVRKLYPYMHPYINQRALTIIRCPEGVEEECFFQKYLPPYSPEFMHRQDEAIVCDDLDAAIWLANHGALEYHIPFQLLNEKEPDQIVFDLDPPSPSAFQMAVETALLFQKVFEQLGLTTFIKTSGSKGLQIHLPLPRGEYTYRETANFTKNMANIIVEAAPALCTTERMKKNRQGKLYIDYVQHGENKTIIAPYSPRKTESATIATPLAWEEVNAALTPECFTVHTVLKRVRETGCPWLFNYEKARTQSFERAAPLFLE